VNVITLNKEDKSVPIIFSWENLTVQTLYKPKKIIINNGKIKLFLIFYLHSNNCSLNSLKKVSGVVKPGNLLAIMVKLKHKNKNLTCN
jgi:hypothetical protein